MPAVISTNITSLIAQNNLSKTQDALQLTIQRLSSGLRVNTAADDASGYAISNRMDALIRGMAVASRNANDGISYSQTTTGALSQITNNLQRMRELAVQAANGSNSSSDTSLLNQEFNQLQTEVNRIQQSTTFNGVNVFQNRDTVFQIGFGTSSNDRVNMVSNALVSSQALGTTTITDSSATASYLDIGSAVSIANTYAAASVTGTANQIAYVYNATVDAVNSNQKLSFTAKNDILNTLSAINSAYNSSGLTAATVTTANFYADTGKVVGSVAAGVGTVATAGAKTLNITLAVANGTSIPSTTFATDSLGTNPVTQAVSSAALSINVNAASVAATAGTLNYTSNTAANGQTNALAAISAIDNALTEANNASAIQGAIQNRFSAVISNLSAFSLSQSAARSRIVDADFAAETSKLAKNQILQQAGTAMLAQANQSPSFVLTLLK
ncbi:flagellin [Polynucleobacter sp. SHI8]|uniref:flagellin N-terminal helical domain-containing protein n=1 Tax=unclassified Polynucleobacter TaxID=2640945 RepID=UPI0024909456|nr:MULTISPECIES: flagellin [unclassified Polynucleobacter]BDW11745.1 flagellin [Polynucleobacter sp. SHI2]BDW14192.1 flagellin [Polynucleobacter sp. SHI8]